MSRRMLSLVGAAAGIAPIIVAVLPAAAASAHGYVSSPPSRQAQCAAGTVSCGDISYEPQSVEGPQGLKSCGADKYPELDDDSKGWKVTDVGNKVDFTWANTAQHKTANWEYYIGDTQVAKVDGKNEMPGDTVTHSIDLSKFTGKQKLLAVWNIGDTSNAFYSCVDLNVGGGEGSGTTAPTTSSQPSSSQPATSAPATTTPGGSTSSQPTSSQPTSAQPAQPTTSAPATSTPSGAN
ncbi:lytic polysaccharide monooxygenase auxiliary activity family 9 protein [Nocardia sp. BMG51109]|uniref:lytic polysaccharide monooxygenase auxiliary activity family 9 protein n=1 Tax=Nocardia sp. BMG51109 TaxID=1056816 RepID=UPI001E344256|nr:lytic polysaccharide monooxygenase auxiliary activity family 9 protein [Nocardia sp. BMG51109]